MPRISLINAVCSPRISACALKRECVLLAIKLAAKRDSGVTRITRSAIFQLMTNIKASVPIMVINPVKSWEKPSRTPSAN